MSLTLADKKIAILVANGFEQTELTKPREALLEAGAQVHIISPESDQVQGWNHYDKADFFPVDVELTAAKADLYDGLLLPGGTVNPDQLRVNKQAIAFIKAFFKANKPVAAICHGPWSLIEADAVRDRTVTSWPSLQTDLKNAGATWVDQAVVVDNGLITSRNPDDIPAFNQQLIQAIAAGTQQLQTV
ncbi:type 1 glutamine amidotransferase domain-containing protein [Lyngbya confervoides]|uniref:Type 1 glutamine amidotransferase n=1 Tax=Lyngbya confervoides BDU141951 TaxID=1574623 RepID=A0ABD4SZH8_9CYAN|nr:type 1 glutamine amidotransferase domain-containing protein [Lyngbya confervoides]MCM1981628.1 type 1 glutamine amidotransferase [Lyngbya confervoides BDU141951]